ncbi:trimeric intracellular cation channel family protein [Halomarina oriensis]|uniref:Trimeric intracellular cation channel family protein n=1 Tax=Halomarina oriensis TaxID=671145 RepID=A0A6B0GKQ8_9EURY|nr:trimeric intracellular cation channel family protein [Halomarina oriensis]MWG35452.1 trimeric intracellular cation channel family protein [Halomarina oriensis]
MVDAFTVMNALGLLAFAAAGALKGAEADLDLFGVVVLGVLTALGGGTLRDVLVGRVPAALRSTADVTVAFVGVALAVAFVVLSEDVRGHPALVVSDAVGLAAFAATGALVGVEAGLSPFGVVVLATLTGVGGGSLADLLLTRVPVVLREDFYATPAAVGGAGFWAATVGGATSEQALLGTAVAVFAVRMLAVRGDWRLPTLSAV